MKTETKVVHYKGYKITIESDKDGTYGYLTKIGNFDKGKGWATDPRPRSGDVLDRIRADINDDMVR